MTEKKSVQYYETIGGDVRDLKAKNPMVRAFGPGPEGTRCKSCRFFYRKYFSKTYFKCEFRGDTCGTATDHRANWPTCKKYEKKSV